MTRQTYRRYAATRRTKRNGPPDSAWNAQEANLAAKAAAAGEQELKGECNALRLAIDAARQAVAARDAECARLQHSLHSSRGELVELAAQHRYVGQYAQRVFALPPHD